LSRGLETLLDDLTYAPGLDVWDPLEEALNLAVPFFEPTGGTLIVVGNSPPRVSTLSSPFSEVARLHGFPTTQRAGRANTWEATLAKLRNSGVTIWYVFLSIDPPNAEWLNNFQLFQSLQARVEQALRTALHDRVHVATADAAGVREAVLTVLRRAGEERVSPSRMEVACA
jgi:hypothetical protein